MIFCRRDKTSSDLTFLSSYHAAKLAEFEFIHNSGVSIDTKSSVSIAGNFALIALIYTQEASSTLMQVALIMAIGNIIIGMLAIFVKNHKGPMANVCFKEDIRHGDEAKVLLQLIEDTEHYTNENLRIVKRKRLAWNIQGVLLIILPLVVCADKFI